MREKGGSATVHSQYDSGTETRSHCEHPFPPIPSLYFPAGHWVQPEKKVSHLKSEMYI